MRGLTLMAMSARSRWLMMKGKSRVMYRATRAEARQGTRMVLLPARMDRISVLASGVRVTDVSRPAHSALVALQHFVMQHTSAFPNNGNNPAHFTTGDLL